VAVDVLDGGEAPARLLAPFASWIGTRRPFVTLKLAVSLDGRIADRRRRSQWISSPAARAYVQALRRKADAILVGAGTVTHDNPRLLPRPDRGRRPLRVVVAARGAIPLTSQVLRADDRERTLVAVTRHCPPARRRALARRGAEVVVLPATRGRVALDALLRELGARDVMQVLCEGGGELAGALSMAGLVDEYILIQAPLLLGGGVTALAGAAGWDLADAPRLEIVESRRLGPDLLLRARAHRKER
jgi:diaminohydroxyphosphoribosylaminopyrimidine deaminase/5-amino-6-(5-phosphoribosylamino)uracil reductase